MPEKMVTEEIVTEKMALFDKAEKMVTEEMVTEKNGTLIILTVFFEIEVIFFTHYKRD